MNYTIFFIKENPKILQLLEDKIEKQLMLLPTVHFTTIQQLSDVKNLGLKKKIGVISALNIKEEVFFTWLSSQFNKYQNQGEVLTPFIFISPLGFKSLAKHMEFVYSKNWYFDVIHPDHLDSLPIRLSNLMRIEDHILEIHRLEQMFKELDEKLENKLKSNEQ